MKQKLCVLALAAFLFSCNEDDSNVENSTSSMTTNASVFAKDELDRPFKSYSYEKVSSAEYAVFFEVPENYKYTITVDKGTYFVDLVTSASTNSDVYINHNENFYIIDEMLNITFRVNGVAVKKPTIIVN